MSWSWWPEHGDGPEHEAWVRPIFHDGELGTGTTCARGIVQHTEWDGRGNIVSERIRPFSDVTHLEMVCECGWTGTRYAVSELPADEIDRTYNEPTEKGEERFHRQWRDEHLAPLRALDDLTELADTRRQLEDTLMVKVATARLGGASWSQIGRALGTTKQAAQQRYGG